MKKILFAFFILIGFYGTGHCSAPSSSFTYVSGTTIQPSQVQTNENNIYSYLQSGVDTYRAGSINSVAISSTAGILYSQLNLSGGILPGDFNITTTTSIYQLENLTVPYNFEIGTPHVGDVFYDNGSSLKRVVGGVTGTVLTSQGNATAPIYTQVTANGATALLGAWTSPSCSSGGTAHQAATDGMFTGVVVADKIFCYTDSASSPSVLRTAAPGVAGMSSGCSSFVKKNDYYMVTTGSVGCTGYFIPLGS